MDDVVSRIVSFFPILVRCSGLVMAAPILGRRAVPALVRLGLSVVVAFVIYPVVSEIRIPTENILYYFLCIGRELLVGVSMGFVVSLVFSAIYLAGQLIDVPMGFGMVNVVDPQSGLQVPIFAQFQYILAALIFLTIRGHHVLLQVLASSFQLIPVGGNGPSIRLALVVWQTFAAMFYLGVKLSLPVVAAAFLTDVALGIIARAVPQMNVFIVGFPAKIAVGLIFFVLMLPAYVAVLSYVFSEKGELGSALRSFLAGF